MARLRKTLIDYVVIAISPALIMVLIGSLVFFLIEVFYGGGFSGRGQYVFGLFVFAAVLIARISIEEGRERAMIYSIPLGGAMLLVCGFTLFNIVVIGVIWWCADKLTWDCTVIDEREDASGEGLLQTVGMDGHSEKEASNAAQTPQDLDATSAREEAPALTNLWERFVERRKRPHAPGVWVIYFSLAALPLFGIGQRFIPDGQLEARQHAFRLLCYYVGSALGLLMTTSFLGLRRYLRQRRLEMPLDMTSVWLTVGTIMILALMLFCALLPRPSAEYSVTNLEFQFDAMEERQASRYGWGNEGAEDEEQVAQNAAPSERETPKPASGPSGKQKAGGGGSQEGGSEGGQGEDGQGESGDGSSGEQGESSGGSSGKQGESGGGSSGEQGESGGDSSGKQGESSGGSSGEQGKSGDSSSGEQSESSGGSESADSDGKKGESQTGQEQAEQTQGDASGDERSRSDGQRESSQESQQGRTGGGSSNGQQPQSTFSPSRMASGLMGGLSQIFKLLYYLFFILLVGYLLWRYREEVMTALRDFLQAIRDFWANLFGGRRGESEDEDAPVETVAPPRPFADFADPFVTGTADRYSPKELVNYSLQALEAWGREHGCERDTEQTPHEYAWRLSGQQALVGQEARTLAELYGFAAYSATGDSLSRDSLNRLRELWRAMRGQDTS